MEKSKGTKVISKEGELELPSTKNFLKEMWPDKEWQKCIALWNH